MAKAPDKPAEKSLDLSGYTLAELDALISEATTLRNQMRDARRAELLAELETLGGLPEPAPRTRSTAGSGTSTSGSKARGPAPVKYRSQKDPSLTWSGRGAQASWLRAEMAESGKPLEAFAVPE